MANSLRAKLSKLRHDGHLSDAEYQSFIKKLDGHDREIRNKAIDDFAELLKGNLVRKYANGTLIQQYVSLQVTGWCNKISEQLKERSSDDVCEWKLEDEESNLYVTECEKRHLIFDGTPKENGYSFCPYCGKKIKVVE